MANPSTTSLYYLLTIGNTKPHCLIDMACKELYYNNHLSLVNRIQIVPNGTADSIKDPVLSKFFNLLIVISNRTSLTLNNLIDEIERDYTDNWNKFCDDVFHNTLINSKLTKKKNAFSFLSNGITSKGQDYINRYKDEIIKTNTQFLQLKKYEPSELKSLVNKLDRHILLLDVFDDLIAYINEFGVSNFIYNEMMSNVESFDFLDIYLEKDPFTLSNKVEPCKA